MTANWASLKFPSPQQDEEERSFIDFPSTDDDISSTKPVTPPPTPVVKEEKLRTPVILPDNLINPRSDATDDAYMGIPCYITNPEHPKYGQRAWIQSSINDTVVVGVPPGCRSYSAADCGIWGQFSTTEIGIEL